MMNKVQNNGSGGQIAVHEQIITILKNYVFEVTKVTKFVSRFENSRWRKQDGKRLS